MTGSLVPGPAGNIQVLVDTVPDALASAIICHPHPLYGGAMSDAVVAALARAFTSQGVTTLRFNFRGVGESDGAFDGGMGEALDVVTLADWLRQQTGTDAIYLAGYSFGAGVALAAAQQLSARALVVVAPPVQMIVVPPVPMLALLGGIDQIVPVERAKAAPAGPASTKVTVLDQADHFFAGEHDTITRLTEDFLGGT